MSSGYGWVWPVTHPCSQTSAGSFWLFCIWAILQKLSKVKNFSKEKNINNMKKNKVCNKLSTQMFLMTCRVLRLEKEESVLISDRSIQ